MGYDENTERELFALDVVHADGWPPAVRVPARYHLCLLAGAMHHLSDGEIHALARRLLDAGAVYLIAWGSAAERVHSLLRDAVLIAERSQAEETVVMTSAYEGPLEDALVFLLADATPSAAYVESCRGALVVTIDAPAAAAVVAAALTAPAEFLARMAASGE